MITHNFINFFYSWGNLKTDKISVKLPMRRIYKPIVSMYLQKYYFTNFYPLFFFAQTSQISFTSSPHLRIFTGPWRGHRLTNSLWQTFFRFRLFPLSMVHGYISSTLIYIHLYAIRANPSWDTPAIVISSIKGILCFRCREYPTSV